MANPILTDQAFEKATASASGADAALPRPHRAPRPVPSATARSRPTAPTEPMTLDGTIAVTGILFVLLLAAAIWGWNQVEVTDGEVTGFPTWSLIAVLIGFGAVLPRRSSRNGPSSWPPCTPSPKGVFVGAISAAYNVQWDGIVVQAVGATLGVFFVMLFLYRARIVTVTDKFRSVVIGATSGWRSSTSSPSCSACSG